MPTSVRERAEQFAQLRSLFEEIETRVSRGTLPLGPIVAGLQNLINGNYPRPKPETAAAELVESQLAAAADANHCGVCHAYIGEGDSHCANGHEIG